MPSNDQSRSLQTAEEIATFLNIEPRTVYYWAESGKIPTAYRVGRTVRFSLDNILDSLNVNLAGEGRSVELVVWALSLTFGRNFPRIPTLDLDTITVAEIAELKRLCAAYAADMEDFVIPQQCSAYAEAVLNAARLVAMGSCGELDTDVRATPKECAALADSLLGVTRLEAKDPGDDAGDDAADDAGDGRVA
jgi:excisionase family DNA binding protein